MCVFYSGDEVIALIAGSYKEAKSWASGQLLDDNEWFYLADIDGLIGKTNFHVVVVGSAGDAYSPQFFEKLFSMAKKKGRMK